MKKQEDFKLFSVEGSLELVARGVFGSFQKTVHGSQEVLVRTDQFKTLTHNIPLRTTTASVGRRRWVPRRLTLLLRSAAFSPH